MAEQPWFKFFASDYLLDPDVDALPREAEALLVRMWCICHREGSCPVDVETLARKTQCGQEYVSQFKPHCEPFFELRDGRLYSRRMEEEKRRSKQARENANRRYRKPGGVAEQMAVPSAEQTAVQLAVPRSDSDFDSGFKNPSPFKKPVFVLEENARARETFPSRYSQTDFDDRDRRKLGEAFKEIDLRLTASMGSGSSPGEKEIFEWACELAGISVERGLEVQARGKKWPQAQTLGGASA
jgi:uncharacterized protein YdaU (DUF1376 family)